MKKAMHSVSVDVQDGEIQISQQLHDLNEPDPEIRLTREQAPFVAAWILDTVLASAGAQSDVADEIPVHLYFAGPDTVSPDSRAISIFVNAAGMVVLKIDDDILIEMSPAMAKRLREQLSVAVRTTMTDMFRPDAEA
jgi:hypothetical protein